VGMNENIQFFTSDYWVEKWLRDMKILNYKIDENLLVHVTGDVNLSKKDIRVFPVRFGVVSGSFYAANNGLESLLGCPHTIGKDAWFNDNELTSAQHSPSTIGGSYGIHKNHLTSFEGVPENIPGAFFAHHNQIVSLDKISKKIGQTCSIFQNPLTDLSNLDFEVKDKIFFTPQAGMDYFNEYLDKLGDANIDFALFKKIQTRKNLENRLNEELPVNSNLQEHLRLPKI
jgi:hypothetical protein